MRRFNTIILFISVAIYIPVSANAFMIKGPQRTLEAPAYRIHGTDYLPLTLICDAYGIDWEWDPATQVVNLNKGDADIRLRVGEYRVYANGTMRVEERPVVLHKGAVCIPSGFLSTIFNKFFLAYAQKPVFDTAGQKITAQAPHPSYYRIKKIVLDAGHGGYDPGAIGRDGIKEKYIVLDITLKIKELFEKEGLEVVLTREDDSFIPLESRVDIANRSDADLFVSIHANASRTRRLKGFEVYYLSEAIDDYARAQTASERASMKIEADSIYSNSETLDATLWDLALTEDRRDSVEAGNLVLDNINVGKRDIKNARFFVLKGVRMPAILIEVGYISNWDECSKLGWKEYRNDISNKIAKGILDYRRKFETTGRFTN
jgi:N-acetylmuramoyl-L-alanine amidase